MVEVFRELWSWAKKHRTWVVVGVVVLAMLYSIFNRLTSGVKPAAQTSPGPAVSTGGLASTSPIVSPGTTTTSPSPTASDESATISIIGGRFFDLDDESRAVFYLDKQTGDLKRYSLVGQASETIGQVSGIVEKLVWSPNHSRVIVKYKTGSDELSLAEQGSLESQIAAIDLSSNQLTPLNKNIVTFEFITNNRIIYHFKDARYSNLSVADANGENWKNIGHVVDATIFKRAGDTVLAQSLESRVVTRFSSDGNKITEYRTPEDFYVDQSDWSSESSSVYWVIDQSAVSINRFTPGKPNQLIGRIPPQADPVILWDNIKGDIYVAGFDGLVKLDAKAGAQ